MGRISICRLSEELGGDGSRWEWFEGAGSQLEQVGHHAYKAGQSKVGGIEF